jgi:hypothetical protein
MGTTKKENGEAAATSAAETDERCATTTERHGLTYRCWKRAGHDKDPRDFECEARAPEYAARAPDWRKLFEETLPLLEWIARHPDSALERRDAARRLIIRHHMALSNPTARLSTG